VRVQALQGFKSLHHRQSNARAVSREAAGRSACQDLLQPSSKQANLTPEPTTDVPVAGVRRPRIGSVRRALGILARRGPDEGRCLRTVQNLVGSMLALGGRRSGLNHDRTAWSGVFGVTVPFRRHVGRLTRGC
jgi:hypothetical protein